MCNCKEIQSKYHILIPVNLAASGTWTLGRTTRNQMFFLTRAANAQTVHSSQTKWKWFIIVSLERSYCLLESSCLVACAWWYKLVSVTIKVWFYSCSLEVKRLRWQWQWQRQKLSTQKYACSKLQCHGIFLLLNGEVGKFCNAAAGCCHTTRMESGLCIFYVPSFAITAATSTLLIWIHSLTVILVTCTNHWHFLFFSFLERQVINLSSDDIPCPAGKQW